MATLAFNSTRLGPFTLSDWLFTGAVGALSLQLVMGNRRGVAPIVMRRSSPLILVGTMIMLVAGTFSSLLSADPPGSAQYVVRLGYLTLVWFWLLRALSPDDTALNRLINGFKIAILIGAAAGILSKVGVIQADILVNESGQSVDRQAGFFGHPNPYSGFLSTGLPFFILDVPRAPRYPHGRPMVSRLLSTGLVLAALLTTGSITAALAMFAGFVTMVALAAIVRSRTKRPDPLKAIGTIMIGVIAVLAIFLSDNAISERINELRRGEAQVTQSADSRSEHADAVIDNFQGLLLVGNGFGSDEANEDIGSIGRTVHNMYLKILNEGGAIALLGFLIIALEAVRQCWRLLFFTRNTLRFPLVLAVTTSLVINLSRSFFQPTLTNRYMWLPIGLAGVLWAMCRHEWRSRPAHNHS